MFTVKYNKINMNRQIVWVYLFTLTFMEGLRSQVTEQGNTHGLQDTLLDVSLSYQDISSQNELDELVDNSSPMADGTALEFSPPQLVFGARPLGTPHSQRVTLTNRANRTLHLTSISGNTNNFHSSFFEDKVLPPNGNTTFSVVFLGRERGQIFASLLIQTSEGLHKYMMTAYSIPGEYRLQPLVGIKIPQNATFSPLIYLHNPHDHMIQVTEVYSSGGGILLELPGGWTEGPQSMWRITPHSTRPVVAVKCHRMQGAHMAYVRIKVDGTDSVLVVAVEVIPLMETGPYAVPHLVDFGYGGSKDPPKQVNLYMGNTSPKPIRITSIMAKPSAGDGSGPVTVTPVGDTWPVILPANSEPEIHIATLSMHWQECFESGQYGGKLIISTNKGQQKILVPYTSQALEGGITYSKSITKYLTSEDNLTAERYLTIKNEFKIPVYLTDIKIGDGISNYFEVKDFWPQSVDPESEVNVFKMRLKSWTESLKFESKIILNTNISAVEIPVYIYNGKLDLSLSIKPQSLSPDTLDLGLVEASSTTRALVGLHNPNPAPVCLGTMGADLPGGTLKLLGCQREYNADATPNTTACACIPAVWWAVYEVSVVAPSKETSLKGEVWINTSHERLRVPVALAAAQGGKLAQVHPTHFHNCFPGTVCSIPLRVSSTFPVDMSVMCVESLPPSSFLLRHTPPPGSMFPLLAARAVTNLGMLHLYAQHLCHEYGDCYSSLQLNSSVGQQWLSLMSLTAETLEFDTNLVNARYSLYLNLTSKSSYNNISVRIDTTQVRNHILEMRMSHVWPRLFPTMSRLLEMPLTQVHHVARTTLRLLNPSTTQPVLVQMLMDWMMPRGEANTYTRLHSGLTPDDCPINKPCSQVSERVFHFPHDVNHCLDSSLGRQHCESGGLDCDSEESFIETSGHSWRSWLPSNFAIHPQSCVFLMQPGAEKNITIEFLANYSARVSSLLYIRNNLTILEVVKLSGQGVVPSFKFGNRKPGSTVPLLFDITEKHLKDCDKEKIKKLANPPNLTVKRTFVARNTGEIPIKIHNFFINSVECEGYGFKVLNCEPFELMPNSTYKVDIAFTPDFTLTRVERMLVIETSLNTPVNYSLVSSIPAHLVGKCAAILRRPSWEATINRVMGSLLICVGISILLAGFYDSDRILKVASVALMRDRGAVQPPLDLRAIGQMGMNKKPENGNQWGYCTAHTEKKPKETPNFKVSLWNNYEDRNLLLDDSKSSNANINQNQKFEEISQSITKSRRKLGKRNSNASDGVDLAAETEVNVKDRKSSACQTPNPSWKHVFSRNQSKQSSQGNSSDSSDTKTTSTSNNKEEVTLEKQNKLPEVPKKLNNLYNGSPDSQIHTNSTQTVLNHVTSNKKHLKSKCHSHSHQSNSGEEDTSSTTTESSNNEENVPVMTSNKKSTPSSGNKKAKCSVQYKDSYEGDGEDEEYDHKTHTIQSAPHSETNTRWMKNRDNVTTTPVHSKPIAEPENKKPEVSKTNLNTVNITQEVPSSTTKPIKKDTYKNNIKKDKQPLSKKRSLDKSFVFSTKAEHSPNTLNSTHTLNVARSSPTTPPAISTVWENKASFSDVVARSDNSLSLFTQGYGSHARESDQNKSHPVLQSTKSTPARNMSLFSNPDSKKCDAKSKNNQDLGPIGSNFYTKKSPTSWSDAIVDKNLRTFANPNVQTTVNKTQKRSEDTSTNNSNANNNNSFFLGSQSYFSGNNLSDMSSSRNQLVLGTENNMTTNNYSSGMNSVNKSGGLFGSAVDLHGNSTMTHNNLRNASTVGNTLRTNAVSQNSCGNMDSGSYAAIGSGQSLLDNDIDGSQLTGMEAFDSPMPWDGPGDDDLGLLGVPHAGRGDNMFDVDYGTTNFYADSKQTPGWTSTSSLWDQSGLGRASGGNSGLQQDGHTGHSSSPLQNNASSIRSQAEWLWGYTNNRDSRGLGAIGSAVPRATPTNVTQPIIHLARDNSHSATYNTPHQQQAPAMGTFDPFHSLSSIWSPGSSLDFWSSSNNQQISNQGGQSSTSSTNPDVHNIQHNGQYQ